LHSKLSKPSSKALSSLRPSNPLPRDRPSFSMCRDKPIRFIRCSSRRWKKLKMSMSKWPKIFIRRTIALGSYRFRCHWDRL
jgi:hypothetical protein